MNQPADSLPIFALDPSAGWDDIGNALDAVIQHQMALGGFGPLFAFAPLTTPANADAWEPLQSPPMYLLLGSIERTEDGRLLLAFRHVEDQLGPLMAESPTSPVRIDEQRAIGDVYDQMELAGVKAFCRCGTHKDDISFFCLLGTEAIVTFNEALRTLPR